MGASQSSFRPPGATLTGSSYLSELGSEIQYEKSMGSSRFLKAIKARHAGSALVVKVFVKDPNMDLRPTSKRMAAERAALADCPSVLAYAQALATERAGYLLRQWVASSLYDRISTRPFLSNIEKKWIAFQLITAVRDIHARKISHGDIKSENVLVTSWNWVYLSDFASAFKPTYLPEDDPSDFSYFFDTSGRRTCYLAPERFYSADSDIARKKETLEVGRSLGRVTEAMDIFSIGCVIAELFVEGTPPFTLSQLFKYRSGEYAIEPYLSQIEDTNVRAMVRSMIALDPLERSTCAHHLQNSYGSILPASFYDFFYDFVAGINEIGPSASPLQASTTHSAQVGYTSSTSGSPMPQITLGSSPVPTMSQQQQTQPSANTLAGQEATVNTPLQGNADEIINRIWTEYDSIERWLLERKERSEAAMDEIPHTSLGTTSSLYPVQVNLPMLDCRTKPEQVAPTDDGPALIILSILCANIRNCTRPASIVRALDVLLALSPFLTDETKLDRMLPFVIALLQNDTAAIRASSLRTLTQALASVQSITQANASIFLEYILPNILPLASDSDESVRCTFAQSLAPLAESGQRYLDMMQAMKSDGNFRRLSRAHNLDAAAYEMSYDASLTDLQTQIQDLVEVLLIDPSLSVKRALLSNITSLCVFLGRSRTGDVFSLMTTHLNDREWSLRSAFFEATTGISTCIGSKNVNEYILPLMADRLADNEENVIARELNSLSTLAELGLYQKHRLWELLSVVIALLVHPNVWIRSGAASLIAASAKTLNSTDVWCSLYPALRKMLRSDIANIDELSILTASVGPLGRLVYEAAVAWASRSPRSPFWQPRKTKDSVPIATIISQAMKLPLLSEEDKTELQRLHTLGMTEPDSFKLLALREYIRSVALTRKTRSILSDVKDDALPYGREIALANLGIVPQNIIFSTSDTLASRLPSHLHQTDAWPRRWTDTEGSRPSSALDLTRPGGGRSVSGSSTADVLRRRLALGNHSAASLHSTSASGSPRPSAAPRAASAAFPSSPASAISAIESSSGTSASTSNGQLARSSATIRPAPSSVIGSDANGPSRSKVNMHGVEVSRVAAAIGADTTTALGLITTESKQDTESISGISRPGAGAQGTNHGRTGGRRFTSTYEGDDPSIKQLLDRVYLDNYREPMPEFGPHVPTKVSRRRTSRSPHPRERVHKRPEGILVAHLAEHTAAITGIAVSPDHSFFSTGSEDGTVRIWDTIRLEKNVTSRSRQVINQGGKITSVCSLEHSYCIASASDNGTIWVNRVDFEPVPGNLPKYGKQAIIRQHYVDDAPDDHATCMLHFDTDSASKLIYGTTRSKIVSLDIRTLRTLSSYDNPLHLGPISCLCIDKKQAWLVVGTLSGNLSLWDLRFGLLLRTWKAGNPSTQQAVYSCSVYKSRGKGRWIVVTLEGSEGFEVWDIESGQLVEDFRTVQTDSNTIEQSRPPRRRTSSAATVTANPSTPIRTMKEAELRPSKAIELLLQSQGQALMKQLPEPPVAEDDADAVSALHGYCHRAEGSAIRTVLLGSDYSNAHESAVLAVGSLPPLSESSSSIEPDTASSKPSSGPAENGWIVSGGEDRKLRFWALGSIERSAIFCGAEEGEDRPVYSQTRIGNAGSAYTEMRSASKAGSGGPNRRLQLINNNQQTLLRAHQDGITALALLELPFRCIVSADRSGIIKVWE